MAKTLEVFLYPIRGPPASGKTKILGRVKRRADLSALLALSGCVAERFNAPDL